MTKASNLMNWSWVHISLCYTCICTHTRDTEPIWGPDLALRPSTSPPPCPICWDWGLAASHRSLPAPGSGPGAQCCTCPVLSCASTGSWMQHAGLGAPLEARDLAAGQQQLDSPLDPQQEPDDNAQAGCGLWARDRAAPSQA